LDVADIPNLSKPSRKLGNHLMYLDATSGLVQICSEPVNVQAINGEYLAANIGPRYIGASYENFEKFWSYAKLIGKNAVAVALPQKLT